MFPLFYLWFNWFCRCLYSTILFVNINFYLFIKKKKKTSRDIIMHSNMHDYTNIS
jgi:hypothetical protein